MYQYPEAEVKRAIEDEENDNGDIPRLIPLRTFNEARSAAGEEEA